MRAARPIIALSAETGRGLDRLMPAVFKVHADWSTKVKTRDLNDWLSMAIQRHPPPAVGGRRVKPKYMAQTKSRPPTFVLFASRADQIPESYRRYLINSIRESFDLPGVPIRVTVKSNKNPYAEGEEKAGQGSARAPFGRRAAPTTGLKAQDPAIAASAQGQGRGGRQAQAATARPSPRAPRPRPAIRAAGRGQADPARASSRSGRPGRLPSGKRPR